MVFKSNSLFGYPHIVSTTVFLDFQVGYFNEIRCHLYFYQELDNSIVLSPLALSCLFSVVDLYPGISKLLPSISSTHVSVYGLLLRMSNDMTKLS